MNILLIRGLMREIRHWGDFPELLKKESHAKSVLGLDLPGVGTETHRIFYPYLREVVRDIRSRWIPHKQNQKDPDWVIFGLSLGGMIAMEWSKMFPGDFKKMVVINSSALDSGKLWHRLKPESFLKLVKIVTEGNPQDREKKVMEMVLNLKKQDPKILEEWTSIAKETEFSKKTALSQLAAAAQFRVPSKPTIPTLVLTSRADRMVDYKNSQAIAQRLQAELHVHPTAGHDLPIDDPAWCVEKISNWL